MSKSWEYHGERLGMVIFLAKPDVCLEDRLLFKGLCNM